MGGGLAVLMATLVMAQAVWASTPYPPQFVVPALRQPQALTQFWPSIGFYGSQRFYLAWSGAQTNKIFYSAYGTTYGSNCSHFSLTACWTPQARVHGPWGTARAFGPPALVDYAGDMYALWAGAETQRLFYSAYNGTTWSAQEPVKGPWGRAVTPDPVAAVVYNGDLWVAWQASSTSSSPISYSYFNGSSWSAPASVPYLPAAENVVPAALVVYQGDLYLFSAPNRGSEEYSIYNGSVWSSPVAVAGMSGAGAAVCDGDLFAGWVKDNGPGLGQEIVYSDFDGSTWTEPVVVPGTKEAVYETVALGCSGDTLYLAWGNYLRSGTSNGALVTFAENVGSPPPPPPK